MTVTVMGHSIMKFLVLRFLIKINNFLTPDSKLFLVFLSLPMPSNHITSVVVRLENENDRPLILTVATCSLFPQPINQQEKEQFKVSSSIRVNCKRERKKCNYGARDGNKNFCVHGFISQSQMTTTEQHVIKHCKIY